MEHLADYFIVLRSTDNKSFEMIDKVPAVGRKPDSQYYSINDNKPVAGTSYYRLKEVDKDGNFYLSTIVSVKFDGPTRSLKCTRILPGSLPISIQCVMQYLK